MVQGLAVPPGGQGLEGVRLHDLRHFTATQLLVAGIEPVTVAGRLGHSTPTLTVRTYAASLPERDRAGADLIGEIVASALSAG